MYGSPQGRPRPGRVRRPGRVGIGTSQATGTSYSYAVNVSAAPLTETARTAYVCEDSEDVLGNQNIRSITAVSPSPQLAKQFVESFKPL